MVAVLSALAGGSVLGQVIQGSQQDKAAAAAKALQLKAQETQQRSLFASQEDQAQLQAEQVASGRQLRSLGRSQLAFQGNTLGVLPDLTGGRAAVST